MRHAKAHRSENEFYTEELKLIEFDVSKTRARSLNTAKSNKQLTFIITACYIRLASCGFATLMIYTHFN